MPAFAGEGGAVPPNQPADKASRLALMIGVDSYNRGWPRKQNAVRDAKLVASEFVRHGYKVAFLENPDARRLNRALKQFFLIDGENPQSQLFVWYSGHVHTVGGRSFLVPTDAPLPRREIEFTSMAFALDDYADLLRRAPASQVYTVIDGPVAAIDFDTRPEAMRDPFAVDLPVRQFLASAAVGQAPADDGVFRRLFLRGLAGINRADGNLDKMLTADEIGAYMANRVAALTKNRQTPLHGRLAGREFAGGDFAFRVGPSHRTDIFAARGRDTNGDADEVERVLWSSIEGSTDPRKFESYLKIYPDGVNAEKAFARLNEVRRDNTVASLSSGTMPPIRPMPQESPQASPPSPQPAPRAAPQPRSPVPQQRAAPVAPAPPAMPVPKVTSSALAPAIGDPKNPFEAAPPAPLPILPSRTAEALAQLASAEAPAFEEMAVPAPPSRAPMPLTPRNLDTGPAPDVLRVRPSSGQRAAPAPSPPPPPSARAGPRANPPPTPVVARPGPEATPSVGLGGKVVQLGAFRDKSVAEKALKAWRGEVPAVFQGAAEPNIVTADLGTKGTYYRIRVAGFADSRKAGDFCAAFRGGARDCYIVPEP